MRNQFIIVVISLFLFTTACHQDKNRAEKLSPPAKDMMENTYLIMDDSMVFYGELIYIPVYSSIFYESEKKSIELSVTLSIHNTDPENLIILKKVNYHNTKGVLLKMYLNEPDTLMPFETINFVVDENERKGGTGANFIIEWTCNEPVAAPIAEAIMITTQMNQGISFTTNGRVIRKFGKNTESTST
jgi:hypothetical protein